MTDENGRMRLNDVQVICEPDELVDYRRMVGSAAVSERSSVLGNGTLAHARIVIETLFRAARETVQLMADHQSDDIYSDPRVRDEVVDFLARGGRMQIIRELHHDASNHEVFWKLVEGKGNVEIRDLPETLHKVMRFHLLIADKKNVRVEDDRELRKAIVGFNDCGLASSSIELFDSIWRRCLSNVGSREFA
jgi:hypothetical protein